MPTAHFSILDRAKLHYVKTGVGSRTLLLFHGFGQDHRVFEKGAEKLSHQYTLYAFDLFFHGQSEWNRHKVPLEKESWKEIVDQFLAENEIEKFSILGFSMGGKFALATLEAFPDRVEEIILIAPDGIKTSFWFSLATYPAAIRNLFKSMIDHPDRFQKIASLARSLGLIDKGVLRFVENQMNTVEKRRKVYYAWVVFRHLQFDLEKIADLINQRSITCKLYVGKFDKVITAESMIPFLVKLKKYEFEILEAGHNDLIEKTTGKIVDR